MQPTHEQQFAIDCARGGKTLALEALAGSGKSSTLKMMATALPQSKRILYTAFSAQVVADAKQGGFGRNVRVSSNHGLAYGPVGAAYRNAGRMERRLTPRVVVDGLDLRSTRTPDWLTVDELAHIGLEAVFRFQQSADAEVTKKHVKVPGAFKDDRRNEVQALGLAMANRIWGALVDPRSSLPITHDTYLKLWALSEPRLGFDLVMVDEAQDANAVVIDLLAKQKTQLVIVGDRYQQIFSFRGALNAMSTFKVEERAWLTQSFRFGNAVAQAANAVMGAHLKTDVRVRGNPAISDELRAVHPGNGCTIIARKNATLIGELFAAKGRVGVVGGVGDLRKLIEGAERLQASQRALGCPDLADFSTWREVQEYAESDAGRDLSVLVRLVETYGTHRLESALRAVDGNERDESRCDLLLTTAHKSKGREWDSVLMLDDFPAPSDADLGEGPAVEGERSKWEPEEANLLYVAATRAKKHLDIANVSAWTDALERCIARRIELPGVTDNPRFNPAIAAVEEEASGSIGADLGLPVLDEQTALLASLYLMAKGGLATSGKTLDAAWAILAGAGFANEDELLLALLDSP